MMKNLIFISTILFLLSILACQKQINQKGLAQQAVSCYCDCLKETSPHKVSNISQFCEDKIIENDSFRFLRVANRWELETDERFFQHVNEQYIRGRDSCFNSVAKKQEPDTYTPTCNTLQSQDIKIAVYDSLQDFYPLKRIASTPYPIFYCYYNGCVERHVGIKRIQTNGQSILALKKLKVARKSLTMVDIWVDTTQHVFMTSKSIFYNFQLRYKDSLTLAHPVFIYNHSDSILSCGKASILFDVKLEVLKNQQWVEVETPPSNLCTPQAHVLLYPHHIIISKVPLYPSTYPRRICLYEGKNKIYSNVF